MSDGARPVKGGARDGLSAREWTGRMVAPLCDAGEGTQASFVASDFSLDAVTPGMRLFVSAQGLYRAFVNGVRVGSDLLTPGWTVYDDRIAYQSYDISDLLRPGDNRIEIWLADGWYRGRLMWPDNPAVDTWGDKIAAIAEITDGDRVLLATDRNWTSGLLPVLRAGIYWGEDFDARIVPQATHAVAELDFDTGLLVPHETGAVRELAPFAPIAEWTDDKGRGLYDFGQNAAGYVRLTVRGEAGATVRVEHAEVLGPDNSFDSRNYRSARAEYHYTLAGGDAETCAPIFTFMGFRYARLTVTGNAEIARIEMVPISSVPEAAGGFSCGVPAVDRLVQNTIWSQRSNFIEVPTDCPQRDERLGWSGDAQVFAGTACWLADSHTFLRKYVRDLMADQRPNGAVPHFSPDPTRPGTAHDADFGAGSTGWGDAIAIIPWQLYLHYGDDGVLKDSFPAMLRWLDYLWAISNGPIIRPPSHWGSPGFTFGDWLQPVGDNRKPRPTIADDCAATLYHFIVTDLTARIAGVIGNSGEAERLTVRADTIRSAFVGEYFSASGRLAHNDQTSYALAFLSGLVPDVHFEAAKAYFRRTIEDADYLIGTGFIGTPALLPALSKLGMDDLAEKVFLNRKVPGWLYQVEQGATTIWERWDAIGPDGTIYDPDMNSYNHYAYGAVCQWLFESVAGVAPDPQKPGFDRVLLAPTVLPELGRVSMWHQCRHGRIAAAWTLENGRATYTVELPEGVEGVLDPSRYAALTLNGAPVPEGQAAITVGAGPAEFGFDFER